MTHESWSHNPRKRFSKTILIGVIRGIKPEPDISSIEINLWFLNSIFVFSSIGNLDPWTKNFFLEIIFRFFFLLWTQTKCFQLLSILLFSIFYSKIGSFYVDQVSEKRQFRTLDRQYDSSWVGDAEMWTSEDILVSENMKRPEMTSDDRDHEWSFRFSKRGFRCSFVILTGVTLNIELDLSQLDGYIRALRTLTV